jgi:hypothetical protein
MSLPGDLVQPGLEAAAIELRDCPLVLLHARSKSVV